MAGNSDKVTADDLVASADTGARNPEGVLRNLIPVVAFIWALFQLYIASNLPFFLTEITGISMVVTIALFVVMMIVMVIVGVWAGMSGAP